MRVVLPVAGEPAEEGPVLQLRHRLQHREGGERLEAVLRGEPSARVDPPVPVVLPVVVLVGVAYSAIHYTGIS